MLLHIDFESRSACDIKKRGGWVYSEDPTTEVLCLAFKLGGSALKIWTKPDLETPICRQSLGRMLDQATEIFAHNMSFEYAIWTNICVPRYGWPPLPLEKLRCSAAKASMNSLPRSLDGACSALGLPVQKDKEGYRLMLKMCKPRKPGKGEDPNGLYWHEKPEDLERLYRYCMQDVEAEECLSNALADLPDQELKVWQLDQVINARGVQADLSGCASMLEMVGEHEQRLTKELNRLTMGAVKTGKQVEEMRKYLRGLGCDLPDLAAATVKQALKKELNDDARRILGIRQSLARSSAAKYSAIVDRASRDGRVRGTLLYHGAGTGRWCLAEGSMILVRDAYGAVAEKPIEQVGLSDQVWDGEEWVHHDGVVFSGVKEVISYDSVVATPSHSVYISDTEYIPLGEAKRRGVSLYSRLPEDYPA